MSIIIIYVFPIRRDLQPMAAPYLCPMIASIEEIQALEKFFSVRALPATLNLNDAVKVTNLRGYVDQVLANLKKPDISETTLRPRYEDLLRIKALLEASNARK